jgi:hypothetical protein
VRRGAGGREMTEARRRAEVGGDGCAFLRDGSFSLALFASFFTC